MGLSISKVKWLNNVNRNMLSIHYDDNEGENDNGENLISEKSTTDIEAHKLHTQSRLSSLMKQQLSEREQAIINLRYGLNNNIPHTIEAIARRFDLSAERIRQFESQSILVLQEALTRRGWQSSEG